MYSPDDYEHALKLKKQGLSHIQIAKKLGIKYPRTVYAWIEKGIKPRGKFLAPNSNMISLELAYVLGVVEGDGYNVLKKTKGHIGLEVKDKDFAEMFKSMLEKWSGLSVSYYFNSKKQLYTVILYSLRASQLLHYFNFLQLKISTKEIKCSFLNGFFDVEGGVSGSNLQTPFKATRFIHAYNTNFDLICFSRDLLESVGIPIQNIDKRQKSGFTPEKTIEYRIRIGGKENMKNFKENIGFSIDRKNKLLNKVLESYVH